MLQQLSVEAQAFVRARPAHKHVLSHLALAARAALTWAGAIELLPAAREMMILRDGMWVGLAKPRSEAALDVCLASGATVVLRHVLLPDMPEAEVSMVPRRRLSFGLHDTDDLLIVQSAGVSDVVVRSDRVSELPRFSALPLEMRLDDETNRSLRCRMEPGDWLYLPAGWWHVARCLETSLSVAFNLRR